MVLLLLLVVLLLHELLVVPLLLVVLLLLVVPLLLGCKKTMSWCNASSSCGASLGKKQLRAKLHA